MGTFCILHQIQVNFGFLICYHGPVFVCVCIVFLERTLFFSQNMFKPFPQKKKKSTKSLDKKGAAKLRGGMEISDSKVKVVLLGVSREDFFFSESISFSRSTLPETSSSPLKIGRAPKVMLVSGMVTLRGLRDLNKSIHSRFCWL